MRTSVRQPSTAYLQAVPGLRNGYPDAQWHSGTRPPTNGSTLVVTCRLNHELWISFLEICVTKLTFFQIFLPAAGDRMFIPEA
jgi:hypothetical protein